MHLLQQNTFEVQCSSQHFGKELHQQLGNLLEKEFYPKLEALFQQYDDQNHTWSIDLLELELHPMNRHNWKTELINQSLLAVEDYLKNNKPFISTTPFEEEKLSSRFIPQQDHASELFFIFLKSGVLPQNAISHKLQQIAEVIEVDAVFLEQLLTVFAENLPTLLRWVFSTPRTLSQKVQQLDFTFQTRFQAFFEAIQAAKSSIKSGDTALKVFFSLPKEQQKQWIEMVVWLQLLLERKSVSTELIDMFVQVSAQHWHLTIADAIQLLQQELKANPSQASTKANEPYLLPLLLKKEKQNNTESSSTGPFLMTKTLSNQQVLINDFQFVNNAGLVIFHPFLERLFEQLGLYKSGVWSSDVAQHKAVLLTQYLVVGEHEVFENDLVLNKILCGIEPDVHINTKLKISKKEKLKCEDLLNAVREYWKPMATSSVEALRETFLQRDAKLDQSNSNDLELWVEEKGYDILLAQLPWGIGTIKTAWMQAYLMCNWA